MSTQVYVAGVGSTKFGVLPGRTLQSLAVEAARAALRDSNIAPTRIGCVFVGNFVGGIMTGQELLGPIVAADLGLSNVAAIKNRAFFFGSIDGSVARWIFMSTIVLASVSTVEKPALNAAARSSFATSSAGMA